MVKTHIKGRDTENKEAFKDNLLDNFASSNGWLKKTRISVTAGILESWKAGVSLVSCCLMLKHR